MKISRRTFLRTSLGSFVFSNSPSGLNEIPSRKPARPLAIFFLVADGLSWPLVRIADLVSRERYRRELWLVQLMRDEQFTRSWLDMSSLNSIVTDSAAASSSWGSGCRVINGALNMLPNGTRPKTLYQLVQQYGWARGLVTTTEITHATPAGFAVNVESRDYVKEIARQYLELGIEVLAGGGKKYFDEDGDDENLACKFTAANYKIIQDLSGLSEIRDVSKWIGLFSNSHLPYLTDQLNDKTISQKIPRLFQMSRLAIHTLTTFYKRFIIQIEGGRIDHAAHANDIIAAIDEVIEFDQVIQWVINLVRQRLEEWLVIITVDHGTGGPNLNGQGPEYEENLHCLEYIKKGCFSFEKLITLTQADGISKLHELIKLHRGISIGKKRWEQFKDFIEGKLFPLYDGLKTSFSYLGQLLANYYGVSWTSGEHTAEFVPLIAYGCGADCFANCTRNIDIFRVLMDLLGIEYEPPNYEKTIISSTTIEKDFISIHDDISSKIGMVNAKHQ